MAKITYKSGDVLYESGSSFMEEAIARNLASDQRISNLERRIDAVIKAEHAYSRLGSDARQKAGDFWNWFNKLDQQ